MPNEPDRGLSILAADDDRDILALVEFVLKREGHRVTPAGDGEAALRHALEEDFDLLVLDVRMPNLTGYEVTERLRASGRPRVPVLLVSASVQDAEVTRGFEAGADDYIRKPFSPRELVERVRTLAQ